METIINKLINYLLFYWYNIIMRLFILFYKIFQRVFWWNRITLKCQIQINNGITTIHIYILRTYISWFLYKRFKIQKRCYFIFSFNIFFILSHCIHLLLNKSVFDWITIQVQNNNILRWYLYNSNRLNTSLIADFQN